jgi:hypothetical protein
LKIGRAEVRLSAGTSVALTIFVLVILFIEIWGPAHTLARGWLLAFGIWSGFPVGSLVLLMIHRLTGGRWGIALAPVLMPAALFVPVVALAFVPIAFSPRAIYPWANDASIASGLHLYLNVPGFILRAMIALVGWSALGIAFACRFGGRLLAGLGLAFYGATISLVAIDWFMSVEPSYTSSAFGATIAVQQILTALAIVAVVGPSNLSEERASDLAAFLIAALLGVIYLSFMTFIVDWYGNLPPKAAWYLKRSHGGWGPTISGSAAFAVLAFGLLLKQSIRRSQMGLRLAGIAALVAIALHMAWLLVPSFPAQTSAIFAALLVSLAFISLGVVARPQVMQAEPHKGGQHAC